VSKTLCSRNDFGRILNECINSEAESLSGITRQDESDMKPQQSARYCHFSEYFHEASKSGGLRIVVD